MRRLLRLALALVLTIPLGASFLGCGGAPKKARLPVDSPLHEWAPPESEAAENQADQPTAAPDPAETSPTPPAETPAAAPG